MQNKSNCLTRNEALEIGLSAARYIGMPSGELELFRAVLDHFIQRHMEQQAKEGGVQDS